jgi:2-keto-4-pentenoate hydratase/2-oxohepta-3-ene-1,7-dioic acid hydratase in catechol pathway
VAVIGTGGRHIPRERALEHVAGYACGHDVSARDWQFKGETKQWMSGKTFDTFAPMGPVFVPAQFVKDHLDLRLRLATIEPARSVG